MVQSTERALGMQGLNTIGNPEAKTEQGFELCFGVNFLVGFQEAQVAKALILSSA